MKSKNKFKRILKMAGNNNETENRLLDVQMNFELIPAWKPRIFCASICINISSVESNTKCRIKSSAVIRNYWILNNWLDTSEILGNITFLNNWLDTSEIPGNITFTLWCYKMKKDLVKRPFIPGSKKRLLDKKKGKRSWMGIWGRNRLFYNGSWKHL